MFLNTIGPVYKIKVRNSVALNLSSSSRDLGFLLNSEGIKERN